MMDRVCRRIVADAQSCSEYIEIVRRERDAALACARTREAERDEARAEVERLQASLDVMLGDCRHCAYYPDRCQNCEQASEPIRRLAALERDEARADAERLRGLLPPEALLERARVAVERYLPLFDIEPGSMGDLALQAFRDLLAALDAGEEPAPAADALDRLNGEHRRCP